MKTIFLHPAVRNYREPWFTKLSEHNIDFLFTSINSVETPAGLETQEILKEIEFNYIQAKETILFGKKNFSWELLKVFRYDAIIFSGITSIPFLLLAIPLFLVRKKVLIFDELWVYPQGQLYRCIRPLVKFLVKYTVSAFIAAGTKASDFIKNEFQIPTNKIHVAFNTAPVPIKVGDESTDLANRMNCESESDDRVPVILYLGRVVKYKGLDVLLRAMVHVREPVRLIVVGDGDYLAECRRLCRDLCLEGRVSFFGACQADEVGRFYSLADLFVLPAQFVDDLPIGYEAWGFTVNEAMAMGLPVIASTAVGSAYDLIRDEVTGWIFEAGNVEALVVCLNNAVSQKERLYEIGLQGQKWLKYQCSYDQNVEAVLSALHLSFQHSAKD
jgi:glycosyltransferase involved in cell wall biosynthesis